MHFNRIIITNVMIQDENGVIWGGQDARVNLIVVPFHKIDWADAILTTVYCRHGFSQRKKRGLECK